MPQLRSDLDQFFDPDGVAVLGRVNRNANPDDVRRMYGERYRTRFYLVNPKGGSVGDIPVYAKVTDIPDSVGLAVINVGPEYAPGALEECAQKGIPYALIFTAGFSEVGPEGAALERQLAEVAQKHGIRVFGPNTNTNAFEPMPEVENRRGGKIGLLTQSGHQGRPVVQGSEFGVAFSRWIPTGNEVDLEVSDFMEYFAYDDETAVVAGYFEGFKDITKLRRALQACNDNRKPVVALKIGSTQAGARMASSHTGHLTGSDAVVDGLFAQHGVTRVRDLDELLETSALFAKLPPETGPGVCLYSISGGSGTLMAEVAEGNGIQLPTLTDETQARLHELIPSYLTVANPVDNGGQFLFLSPQADRLKVFDIILDDPNVDVLVIGITGALGPMTDNFAKDILDYAPTARKPVVATWNSFKTNEQGFSDLVRSGVPMFRSFRNCFAALGSFYRHQEKAKGFRARVPLGGELPAAAAELLTGGTLDPAAARTVLEAYDLPLAKEAVVTSAAEAAKTAEEFGFPVVMKIASADFPHKSDDGLVRLDVPGAPEAEAAYTELVERARSLNPSARVDGVLVQEQVTGGTEVIVGVSQDPVLGPAVMVGTGGVFAEVLRDVSVRPLPIDRADVEEMVRSLRGFPLLDGARGRPKGDVDALVDTVLAVARLASAAGPRLAELDLNPVIVRPQGQGVRVVDSLVVAAEG